MWEKGKKKLHIYIGGIRESQQSCKDLKKKAINFNKHFFNHLWKG